MRHLGIMATLGRMAVLLAAGTSTVLAANRCKLMMFPPVPVKMESMRPVVAAEIDGVQARFILDTGSFFDFLSSAVAAEYKLPLSYAPPWFYVRGVGGAFNPEIATAKRFSVAGIAARDAQFLVGNNDFRGGIAGILGQNILRLADVDFDFADGVMRFVKPRHCGDEMLAYWAGKLPIGVVDLHWTSKRRPALIGKAEVNGHRIEVMFDTGSWRSILSLDAARRAGITPGSPGVVPAGRSIGLGNRMVKVWAAPVAEFEIGDEKIEHTRLLIGDIGMPGTGADMLLGSDFFLAHHVYVAYSQNKLYFTYNGGPVFDLNGQHPAQTAGNAPPSAASPRPTAPAAAVPVSDAPTDASGIMRRGMAEASRAEYPQAIADLTRACALEPTDAGCRYQRGLAYWRSARPRLALADFDAAIQLQPNDFEAHLARARLEMARHPQAAQSDLDTVDRLAPQEDFLRLPLARLYGAAGEYAGAVHQYDLWIDYHRHDVRLPYALSGRCGSEAASNVDLHRALADCNKALRLMGKGAPVSARAVTMSNLGLVYLRQSRLSHALAEFDAALKQMPGLPAAQYARALAELRKGLTAAGRADLAAVQAHHPALAKRFAAMGLTP
jgi:tetratricopeptide (TPR) repeat protein